MKIYVGQRKNGSRKVLRVDVPPTEESHGAEFFAVIGPFRTIRGAKAQVHYGAWNNPHIQHVRDAERIGKQYADDLAKMGEESPATHTPES